MLYGSQRYKTFKVCSLVSQGATRRCLFFVQHSRPPHRFLYRYFVSHLYSLFRYMKKLFLLLALVFSLFLVVSNFSTCTYDLGLEPVVHVYNYQSTDGGFQATEIPEKGKPLTDIVEDFQTYQRSAHAQEQSLCRCFKKNYLQFWKWREYSTHERWKMKYCPCDGQ